MKLKKTMAFLLILALVLSMVACAAAPDNDGPSDQPGQTSSDPTGNGDGTGEDTVTEIKVGVLFPITGAAASVAEDARKGFDLALDYVNEHGGIEALGGAKIVPIYSDTQSDEQAAVTEAERLIVNENVSAIIGCYQSAITMAVYTVCEKYGCPLLECCCSSPSLIDGQHDWSFLVHETSAASCESQLRYIKQIREEGFEIKTAALLYENDDNGQTLQTLWSDAFDEMGIEIIIDETFAMDVSDVTPIVNKLQRNSPDIVMCFANFDAMVLLTNTMVGKGYAPNLMMCASGGEQNSDFIPNVGNNADGFMTAMGWGMDVLAAKPDKMWIAEAYAEKNNNETFTGESAAGWSVLFLLVEGLNAAGKNDRTALRDALANMEIEEDRWWNIYPYGIDFDETGANIYALSPLGQFQDTHVAIIWPESAVAEGTSIVLPGSELSVLNK